MKISTVIAGGAALGMTLGQIYHNSQTPMSQINPPDITPIELIQPGPTPPNDIPKVTPHPDSEPQTTSEQSPIVEPIVESNDEILRQIQDFGNKQYRNLPGIQEQKVIDKLNENVKPQPILDLPTEQNFGDDKVQIPNYHVETPNIKTPKN